MPNDNNTNVSNLATASPNALITRRYDERDEAVFLQQQADDAKKAMRNTLAAMRETAKTAADIKAWTQAYPWHAVGAGAATGFLAASLLPSFKGGAKQAQADTHGASRSPLVSFVNSSLLGVIRNVVISTITSALVVNAQAEESDEDDR
jgi:ElaB/YqjD/DUF883 family membrane-anchored ribosome-binding protein